MFALLPVLAGCGSNPFNPPIDPGGDGHVPGDTPVNDSPQNLMIRFEKSYEFQDLQNYSRLLTSDFRYIALARLGSDARRPVPELGPG